MLNVKMKFLDLVKQRRSVRNYLEKPVSGEIIEKCLEAARLAPSACNSQPWKFLVVTDPTIKNLLAQEAFGGIYAINSFAKRAPVLVVVIRDTGYIVKLGSFLRNTSYSLIDLGAASEHLVLQATEAGLGSCFIGWFNEKKVKKILGLRQKSKIDLIISLGYAAREILIEKKRRSLNEIRHFF